MNEYDIAFFTVLGGVVLCTVVVYFCQHELKKYANTTVGAVYRAALHSAQELEDAGIKWLLSEPGIAYRRLLIERAYDFIPDKMPLALAKALISRDQFCTLVESAFVQVVLLADDLESGEKVLPPANENIING